MMGKRLTIPQQNIWNLQKFYADTSISNICGAFFFGKKVDNALLNQAINHLICTQEGMRIYFCEENGKPAQYIREYQEQIFSELVFENMNDFDAYAEKYAKVPFDLKERQLYRFLIIEINGQSGVLLCINHLISDAWSLSLIGASVKCSYETLLTGHALNEKNYSYKKISENEKIYLHSDRYKKSEFYWQEKYINSPEESFIRPGSIGTSVPLAKRYSTVLTKEETMLICMAEKKLHISPAILFEASVMTYLSKVNIDNKQISIGVLTLNRFGNVEKNTVGMCVSTLPLTVDIKQSNSLGELCEYIALQHMQIFRHQKYPYSHILNYLREEHKFNSSLYEVIVSYQNAKTDIEGSTKWYSNGYSEVPLQIHIDNRDNGDGYTVTLDYQTQIFSEDEIVLLKKRLFYIAKIIVNRPDTLIKDVYLMPPYEYNQVVFDFNNTEVAYIRNKCVHELFNEKVQKFPAKVALIFEGKEYTYKQLDEMSNSLAHILNKKGIGRGDIVPYVCKKSWHIIVAMLGILKAGAAYMPVDLSCPNSRIISMLETGKCKLVFTYGYVGDLLIESVNLDKVDYEYDIRPISNANISADICYVIFTSGSTGQPKGVSITHRNVVNYSNPNKLNVRNKIITDNCHKLISLAAPTFDMFTTESLLALLNNITIILPKEEDSITQDAIAQLIWDNDVDVFPVC